MAMTAQNANGDVLSDINTTPLIDVMLVLLTLLIITLPLQTHAVHITMPRSGPPKPIPSVMLEVDFDGTPVWNGWRIDDATLDRKLYEAAHSDPQPEVHIMANRLAHYDSVVKVMVMTQHHGLYRMDLVDTKAY